MSGDKNDTNMMYFILEEIRKKVNVWQQKNHAKFHANYATKLRFVAWKRCEKYTKNAETTV